MTVRPVPSRALGLVVLTAAALYLSALTTGSGWLMLLFGGTVALFAISVVWPLVVLAGVAGLDATAPADAVAGRAVTVRLRSSGRSGAVTAPAVRVRVFAEAPSVGSLADAAASEVEVVIPRHGLVRGFEVELSCGFPVGLVWWRAVRRAPLAQPLCVAPRTTPVTLDRLAAAETQPDDGVAVAGRGDLVRDVRPYREGDPVGDVHWSATARAGALMVKERETLRSRAVTLVVSKAGSPEVCETIAEQAAGAAETLLAAGMTLRMITREGAVVRDEVVRDAREVGRRLARADGALPGGVTPDAHVRVDATFAECRR